MCFAASTKETSSLLTPYPYLNSQCNVLGKSKAARTALSIACGCIAFPCGKSITIAQGNTCERTSTPTECLSAGPGQKLSLHNHNRNHDEAASVTTTTTMSTGCPRVFYPWQILVQQSAATATATATETTTAASKKKSLVEMLQEQRKRVAESLTMANAQQNG